ncbi:hypothetical protein T484DRAFT_2183042 [Baffinella frigidus]|nr:hypothetical protein T484DRAFT_2183042 [Cryptophyta sp. CCMP2293]
MGPPPPPAPGLSDPEIPSIPTRAYLTMRRAHPTPSPRRAYPSRGGPIRPETGLSVPRRAYPTRQS